MSGGESEYSALQRKVLKINQGAGQCSKLAISGEGQRQLSQRKCFILPMVLIQPMDQLGITLGTTLASIGVGENTGTTTWADIIPVTASANFAASNAFDIFLTVEYASANGLSVRTVTSGVMARF